MTFWIFIGIVALSYILILSFIEIAKTLKLVDVPSERRNHVGIVPRGAGIVLVCVISISAILLQYFNPIRYTHFYHIIGIFLILGLIFFIEDIKSLRSSVRFIIQILVAIVATYTIGNRVMIFENLPYIFNFICVTIGWVWFMNLYNFMDGIDGMTSTNTIFFCLASLILISYIPDSYIASDIQIICTSVIATMIPYLILNFRPARVFMGDSGSIPIGFLIGYMFLSLVEHIGIFATIVIPSYYVSDATITLLMRIKNKEDISQPHLKHFFHIANRGGLSTSMICFKIFMFNMVILAISIMLFAYRNNFTLIIGLLLCFFANTILLRYFYSYRRFIK